MNFKSPELTNAWHFGVQSQPRICGFLTHCLLHNSVKQGHVQFLQMANGRIFGFSCFNRDPRLQFRFSQFIPKVNKPLFYRNLKNVRDSLLFTWLWALCKPLTLPEILVSCCFDFTGIVQSLRSLTLASSLQWSLWASGLSVFIRGLMG